MLLYIYKMSDFDLSNIEDFYNREDLIKIIITLINSNKTVFFFSDSDINKLYDSYGLDIQKYLDTEYNDLRLYNLFFKILIDTIKNINLDELNTNEKTLLKNIKEYRYQRINKEYVFFSEKKQINMKITYEKFKEILDKCTLNDNNTNNYIDKITYKLLSEIDSNIISLLQNKENQLIELINKYYLDYDQNFENIIFKISLHTEEKIKQILNYIRSNDSELFNLFNNTIYLNKLDKKTKIIITTVLNDIDKEAREAEQLAIQKATQEAEQLATQEAEQLAISEVAHEATKNIVPTSKSSTVQAIPASQAKHSTTLQAKAKSQANPSSTLHAKAKSQANPSSTSHAKPSSTSHANSSSTSHAKPSSTSHANPSSTSQANPSSTSHAKPSSTSQANPSSKEQKQLELLKIKILKDVEDMKSKNIILINSDKDILKLLKEIYEILKSYKFGVKDIEDNKLENQNIYIYYFIECINKLKKIFEDKNSITKLFFEFIFFFNENINKIKNLPKIHTFNFYIKIKKFIKKLKEILDN